MYLPLRHRCTIRLGQLIHLTFPALIFATLPGCFFVTDKIADIAEGEPRKSTIFALSVTDNNYEITRKYETLRISRGDLPTGCDSARFFLNDSANELEIGHHQKANWVTEDRPPLPDDRYPPCTLLLSYGSFSEPQPVEGLVITNTSAFFRTSKCKQPHPAAWVLSPATFAADVWLNLAAVYTVPVWVLPAIVWARHNNKTREKATAASPPPIVACLTTIEEEIGGIDQPFSHFEWDPTRENAYVLEPVNEVFSGDNPVAIDTRVRLRNGRVAFRDEFGTIWTDADVECGLQSGNVAATRVTLSK